VYSTLNNMADEGSPARPFGRRDKGPEVDNVYNVGTEQPAATPDGRDRRDSDAVNIDNTLIYELGKNPGQPSDAPERVYFELEEQVDGPLEPAANPSSSGAAKLQPNPQTRDARRTRPSGMVGRLPTPDAPARRASGADSIYSTIGDVADDNSPSRPTSRRNSDSETASESSLVYEPGQRVEQRAGWSDRGIFEADLERAVQGDRAGQSTANQAHSDEVTMRPKPPRDPGRSGAPDAPARSGMDVETTYAAIRHAGDDTATPARQAGDRNSGSEDAGDDRPVYELAKPVEQASEVPLESIYETIGDVGSGSFRTAAPDRSGAVEKPVRDAQKTKAGPPDRRAKRPLPPIPEGEGADLPAGAPNRIQPGQSAEKPTRPGRADQGGATQDSVYSTLHNMADAGSPARPFGRQDKGSDADPVYDRGVEQPVERSNMAMWESEVQGDSPRQPSATPSSSGEVTLRPKPQSGEARRARPSGMSERFPATDPSARRALGAEPAGPKNGGVPDESHPARPDDRRGSDVVDVDNTLIYELGKRAAQPAPPTDRIYFELEAPTDTPAVSVPPASTAPSGAAERRGGFRPPQKLADGRIGYPLSPTTAPRGETIGTRPAAPAAGAAPSSLKPGMPAVRPGAELPAMAIRRAVDQGVLNASHETHLDRRKPMRPNNSRPAR